MLIDLLAQRPEWRQLLHPSPPYPAAEAVRVARHELARSVEDALARRMRALLLEARKHCGGSACGRAAGQELGRDHSWQKNQVHAYWQLAPGYILG